MCFSGTIGFTAIATAILCVLAVIIVYQGGIKRRGHATHYIRNVLGNIHRNMVYTYT